MNLDVLYLIKILNKKIIQNTYYDIYLCIFSLLKKYLQPDHKN